MKKLLFLFLATAFSVSLSYGQCDLYIDTPSEQVDCGDCFTLTAVGDENAPLFNENFNNSMLGPGWQSNVTVMYSNPCGNDNDGTPHAWFGNTSFPRELITTQFDITCGATVCFDMKYATQGGSGNCEGPDLANEGVHFQYSTNYGVSWVDIQYWSPNGGYDPNLTQWNNYCVNVPNVALTNHTMFRWYQDAASSNSNDHWGIDNVVIDRVPCGEFYYDWFVDGTPNSADTTLCLSSIAETYTVVFTNGISDTCTASITISQNSTLDVNLGPDTILNCGTNFYNLYANESGGSGSYSIVWSTGANNVNHLNNQTEGTYWVEITDANEPLCKVSDTVKVKYATPPAATLDYISVCEEGDITFTDVTVPGDGNIILTEWDVNADGIIDNVNILDTTMSFTGYGYHDFILIVSDDRNCVDTLVEKVKIYAVPDVDFEAGPLCFGQETHFTDLTFLPNDTDITTWSWNFNNQGATSNDQNPSHVFSGIGTYNVKLTVTSSDGCVGDTVISIFVGPGPVANFLFEEGCAGDTLEFIDNSSGIYDNPHWFFGDDPNAVYADITYYSFKQGGTYDVTFIINDPNGVCDDTITKTLNIIPGPDVSFTATPMEGVPVLDVTVFANSTDIIDSYWDWGDGEGGFDNSEVLNHSYNDAGDFTIQHVGEDTNGCKGYYSLLIKVYYDKVIYTVPNIITPNGDDINDGFYLTYLQGLGAIGDFKISIVNRWGNVIREYKDPEFIWDGKDARGNKVNEGVYFYKIYYKMNETGTENVDNGFVHVAYN